VARSEGKKEVSCPVETTIRVVGGRWKVLAIHHLLEGSKRFGELVRALKGVSARTLAKQLRELEADGIVAREVHSQIPLKVEYSLTEAGMKLKPALLAMHDWGLEFEGLGREKAGREGAIKS
jgi:DNA-binding HxlR family transcriptional regulator